MRQDHKTVSCPCNRGINFEDCCGQFIDCNFLPHNPEALMRSRYSAYARHNLEYVKNTMRGKALRYFNHHYNGADFKQQEWLQLTVVRVSPIQPTDRIGYVEFIAEFSLNDQIHTIHEKGRFEKFDNKWYYTDGQKVAQAHHHNHHHDGACQHEHHEHHEHGNNSIKINKIGRNDPCVCGSGKKYKKCCLI